MKQSSYDWEFVYYLHEKVGLYRRQDRLVVDMADTKRNKGVHIAFISVL